MENVFIIAKKEFGDLLSNKIIMVTIAVYLLLISFNLYDFYSAAIAHRVINFYGATIGSILYVLIEYGAILAIVIGVISISNERYNNALNVLVSKPLYRDTIINGKLIGSLCFVACIFSMVIAFYTLGLFLLFGNMIATMVLDYFIRVPVTFFVSIVYVSIFLSLAMFISIIVKDQAFSMITSIIVWSLLCLTRDALFVGNMALLFPGNLESNANMIAGFSPLTMIYHIGNSEFFNPGFSPISGKISIEIEVFKLIIYLAIATAVCYIGFVRSDVR